MNILILSWRSPGHPNEGGAEKVTLEHAKYWVKSGHEVVWFSSEYPGGKIQENIGGMEIIRKGGYVVGVRLQAILWYFFGRHPKFDLVIDEFHGIPFFTPLFVKQRKLAFIHEVAKEVWKLNPWPKPFHLIPSVLGTFLEPFVFKLLYKKVPFMTVSDSTKEDLIKWGIPRGGITVVNNGVSLNLPKQINKSPIKTAMYLGAISEDKGTFDALKVFAGMERKDEGWRYWLVGKGNKDFIVELKKEAKALGISDKLTFMGFVDEKKKFNLLAQAWVLVNPSIREGWGLVNIEAAASQTPVFGYDVAGMRDSVKNGKTGVLVKAHETMELEGRIIETVSNKQKMETYRKNCKNWAGRFSWDKSNSESLELIESL
jgi:glycosyltransferase involved in cell wall biosynthesis